MNEHGFVRAVHRQVPDSIYKWKINDNYQGGVADAYYSGNKGDMWVEYKFLKALPVRETTPIKIGLTAQQRVWLNARHDEGRTVAVVVGSPDGHVILEGKSWCKSMVRPDFIRSAVDTKGVAAYIMEHTTTIL